MKRVDLERSSQSVNFEEMMRRRRRKAIVAGRKKRSWPSRPVVLPCKNDCESEVKGKDTGETYSCSSFVRVYLGGATMIL